MAAAKNMGARELPVLNFSPFRNFPTKLERQDFKDPAEVCNHCVSGACCTNQDAIALSSFDIFRLAAFFDMSPARFMLTFTQDKFDDDDDEAFRKLWNNNPNSSVVTWLRRRTSSPYSPCIFLKYIRDTDGTPHRICSVHDARPLSCREYYFAHCKTRGTGELAALLAEGFEKVRDGEITEEMVDAGLARFGEHDFATSTLAEDMEYGFWVEMKCVLHMDQANLEGSNSYNITHYQDPIDEKLNRVLSSKYLRSEEAYGWKPRDEQLMPYTSGLRFAGSSEYWRIIEIARKLPSTGLFARPNYAHYVGIRTMMPAAKHSDFFPAIPESEICEFLDSLPHAELFPQHSVREVQAITLHDLCAAVLRASNYLIQFASHVASLEPILESDPPGTIETEILKMLVDFETSFHPFLASNQYLEAVKRHMAARAIENLETRTAALATDTEVFDCFKSLAVFHQTTWKLPRDLQLRVNQIRKAVKAKIQDKPQLYIDQENPVAARQSAGKRLDSAHQAWGTWYSQVLDVNFAALAGLKKVDLPSFYLEAVSDLERLPLRKSYARRLFDVVKYLGQSMSLNHRLAYQKMPYKAAADRLASYGVGLFNWRASQTEANEDCEMLANFLVAMKDLGRGLNEDENFGIIIYRILNSQCDDGSWNTSITGAKATENQAEFLEQMYRGTWACINALRLTQTDVKSCLRRARKLPTESDPAVRLVFNKRIN